MEKGHYLKKKIVLALAIGMATCGNIAMVAGYEAAGGTSAGGNASNTSIAIGNLATANQYGIAAGNKASASGMLSTAIGNSSTASGVLSRMALLLAIQTALSKEIGP